MKKVRGYIFSRPFLGERIPQAVQNLVIRDFCERNNLMYLLSATEYAMINSSKVLFKIINEKNNEHIILYSLFQLPENPKIRNEFHRKAILNGKVVFFAIENTSLNKYEDVEKIEDFWSIKNILPNCLSSF